MAFTARSAATIRDALLEDWRARYVARGADLDITEDGDAWALAEAIAIEQEALELGAQEAANRVLVRSTFSTDLDDFAEDQGTGRFPASATRLYATVTGANSTTYPLAGETLNSSRGIAYLPIDTAGAALTSVATDGSGNATVLVEAQTAGTDGNLALATVLTWSSPPSGMGATGVVAADAGNARDGEDEESDTDLQTRILELMRERPASGNRADVRSIALEITGVVKAYVYPLLAPARVPPETRPAVGTPHTSGTWTVVVMGDAQGDSVSNERVIGPTAGAELTTHKGYFEGTHDAAGSVRSAADAVFSQRRHVTLETANYTVEAVNVQAQNVAVTLVLDSSASWSWTGAAMAIVSSTTTTLTIAGDVTATRNGKDALVFIGTGNTRGGWTKINLGTGVFGGVNTVFTFTALAAAPTTAKGCYPAPSNWSALRLAAFAHMDALGPSDVNISTYPRSARFPPESWGDRATLYPLRLGADLMAVSGVLTATVTTPAATVVASQAKTLVTLDEFLVSQ